MITCGTFMDREEFKKALEGALKFFPVLNIGRRYRWVLPISEF